MRWTVNQLLCESCTILLWCHCANQPTQSNPLLWWWALSGDWEDEITSKVTKIPLIVGWIMSWIVTVLDLGWTQSTAFLCWPEPAEVVYSDWLSSAVFCAHLGKRPWCCLKKCDGAEGCGQLIRKQKYMSGHLDWLNDRWMFIPSADFPNCCAAQKHLQVGDRMIYMHQLIFPYSHCY